MTAGFAVPPGTVIGLKQERNQDRYFRSGSLVSWARAVPLNRLSAGGNHKVGAVSCFRVSAIAFAFGGCTRFIGTRRLYFCRGVDTHRIDDNVIAWTAGNSLRVRSKVGHLA